MSYLASFFLPQRHTSPVTVSLHENTGNMTDSRPIDVVDTTNTHPSGVNIAKTVDEKLNLILDAKDPRFTAIKRRLDEELNSADDVEAASRYQALRLSSSTASAHVPLESCKFHPSAPVLWLAVLDC